MRIECRTIDDYRKVRLVVRGLRKSDRSHLKREVKRNTLAALTGTPGRCSTRVRRAYRTLWHEAAKVREAERKQAVRRTDAEAKTN